MEHRDEDSVLKPASLYSRIYDDSLRLFVLLGRERSVELRSLKTGFSGRILDLSRGGLQVAIMDPSFYEGGGDGLALVMRRFPRGATIRFVEEGIAHRVRIVRITPHQFRHLAAAIALDARPDGIGLVKDLLGHKNVKTTVAFYSGMRTREAAREYDKILATARRA